MGSSENLQRTEFIDYSMPIVSHRAARAHRRIDCDFLAWKTLLLSKQGRKYVLTEVLFVAFCPVGRASRAIHCRAVKNTGVITFVIEISGLSLEISSSCRSANAKSDSKNVTNP
jgi:hypothetical protein